MNYGRKKAAKKRKDITSKSKLKKKRLGRTDLQRSSSDAPASCRSRMCGRRNFYQKSHR